MSIRKTQKLYKPNPWNWVKHPICYTDNLQEQGSVQRTLKDLYHLKPGWLRKPLVFFFGSYYFYLHEYSLSCLQLFQSNSMTKIENSTLKSYQCPGIICSICLAISYFSIHNKNNPSLTRFPSVSLNPKALYKLLEHSLHIFLDSRQMWGPVWNSVPKCPVSPPLCLFSFL